MSRPKQPLFLPPLCEPLALLAPGPAPRAPPPPLRPFYSAFLPPSNSVNFLVGEPAPLALLADPPMPWHASFTLASGAALSPYTLRVSGLGFRVEGLSFKVWGLEFRISGLWALVGFRAAAFRNNAPQPGRCGRREAFKINLVALLISLITKSHDPFPRPPGGSRKSIP